MSVWTFVWLMFILKIPIVALFLIVRWAVLATPESSADDGGTAPRFGPLPPHHPRAPLPRLPRRGPHGERSPAAPSRIRSVAPSARLSHN